METVCQPSYPLNAENASPFGTRTANLAWPVSCAEMAPPPKTASTETESEITTITTAGNPLLFIASLLVVGRARPRCSRARAHVNRDPGRGNGVRGQPDRARPGYARGRHAARPSARCRHRP